MALAAWLSTVLLAVNAGVYEDMGEPPLPLLVSVAGPIALLALGYARSARVRSIILALDQRMIVGAQLWRVVGAGFLFAMAFGRLPSEFAIPAGWGDIATGIAAMPVLLSLIDGTLTRGRLYAFTALGVGDFVSAIVAGLALRPLELDLWPLILFPTVAVPLFGSLHLVAILQFNVSHRDRTEASGGSRPMASPA